MSSGVEEEVPGLPELARVALSLLEPARMGRVDDGQPVHDLGVVHRGRPGDADQTSTLRAVTEMRGLAWLSRAKSQRTPARSDRLRSRCRRRKSRGCVRAS